MKNHKFALVQLHSRVSNTIRQATEIDKELEVWRGVTHMFCDVYKVIFTSRSQFICSNGKAIIGEENYNFSPGLNLEVYEGIIKIINDLFLSHC